MARAFQYRIVVKHIEATLLAALLICTPCIVLANTPTLADADKLFDFAETTQPTLFFPSTQTQQANQAGSDWFFRYFPGSDSYAAININGTGPFFAGNVYVSGAQFGAEPLLVGSLQELLAAVDAAAEVPEPTEQRTNAITNQGSGTCTERKFAAQNDTATFRTTTTVDGVGVVTTRTEFYELVSDTKTITVIETTATAGGSQVVTANRLSAYYQSSGGMFYNTGSDSVITTRSDGNVTLSQDSNIAYTPALFIGPPEQLCVGQEWFAAPVTETLTSDPDPSGNGPVVTQTPATVATINSIGETVSVTGGTYDTIKMTLVYPDRRTVIWTDLQFGVRVKAETYEGDADSPTIVEELTSFELPF